MKLSKIRYKFCIGSIITADPEELFTLESINKYLIV